MKKIVYQENFAFIYLNTQFYNKQKIKAAISNYNDFVEHSLGELGKYFVLKISLKNNDHTLKTLAEEISNFILSEEYQKHGENN